MGIEVLQGGMLTTVQDLGRIGYQQQGVSPGGAMDSRSFRLANYLVGNFENDAALEATMIGPKLRFTECGVFAVTGGDMSPCLNGRQIAMYRAIRAEKGDVLSFGTLKTGCRSYIAFAGGLDVPQVMGSRSTLLRGAIGGYRGRKLEAGDAIGFLRTGRSVPELEKRALTPEDFSAREVTLRIVFGPQEDRFTEEALQTYQQQAYTVTAESDRMGCRLEGPRLTHKTDANIITDGIALGSVQVPGSGKPIIMMADRQSTGGYTKIASVISVDIPRLAQCAPGTAVRFLPVTLEQAQRLYRRQHEELEKWKKRFAREYMQIYTVTWQDEFTCTLTLDGLNKED